ncbi:MAG TPA: DUF2905 family protein [candidate division Zixibacteria bacterium]|jgi:hypothetical protein
MASGSQTSELGRLLIVIGGAVLIIGIAVVLIGRAGWPWRPPGDILLRGRGWSVWIPITSSIILSLLLTLILNIWRRH